MSAMAESPGLRGGNKPFIGFDPLWFENGASFCHDTHALNRMTSVSTNGSVHRQADADREWAN